MGLDNVVSFWGEMRTCLGLRDVNLNYGVFFWGWVSTSFDPVNQIGLMQMETRTVSAFYLKRMQQYLLYILWLCSKARFQWTSRRTRSWGTRNLVPSVGVSRSCGGHIMKISLFHQYVKVSKQGKICSVCYELWFFDGLDVVVTYWGSALPMASVVFVDGAVTGKAEIYCG